MIKINSPEVINADISKKEIEEAESKALELIKGLFETIDNKYQETFKEIFNVIDLSLDDKKAEIAKSSIGHTLQETKEFVANSIYHHLFYKFLNK
jgi:hypothetical protein